MDTLRYMIRSAVVYMVRDVRRQGRRPAFSPLPPAFLEF